MIAQLALVALIITFVGIVAALCIVHEFMTGTYYREGYKAGRADGRKEGFKAGLKRGRAFSNPPHSWK